MKALRVGLFTECYRPIQNGIVVSVDALARSLRARAHQALVITPSMPGSREEWGVVRLPSLPLPLPTVYRLTLPYLPQAGRNATIVHAHSPFVTGLLGAVHARRSGVPLVFTYHTQLEAYAHYLPLEAHATRSGAKLLTRAYANFADAVVVPTQAMEERLRVLGVRSRIVVVPSGIDVAAFSSGRRSDALRARLGLSPCDRMLLTVGRLGREKNVELLLRAFATVRSTTARLVIVGDGADRARLELQAAKLGISARTTFAREVARATLPDVYACADAFAFASRSETQGLVLVEALAAGVPVVALDTPQTREVLGGAGSLVADDPAAFASALEDALAGTEATRTTRAAAGAAVAARYDAAALGDRLIALYDELLHAAPRSSSPTFRDSVDIEHTFA